MRFILEIQTGGQTGRKVWLTSGQMLHVGRTERAEFVVPDDGHMSGLHFVLEPSNGDCRIRDLGSSNGTFVNGRRVETAALRHGDQIRAGRTCFLVRQESAEDPQSMDLPPGDRPDALPAATAAPHFVIPPRTEPTAGPWHLTESSPTSDEAASAGPVPPRRETLCTTLPASEPSAPLEAVVIEVLSGSAARQRIPLRPGQHVTIGRTERADVAISDDHRISEIHLQVNCDGAACRIRDLKSSNGTFLNGQRVEEAAVSDGDEIRAGETVFVARVRGGLPVPNRPPHPGAAALAAGPGADAPAQGRLGPRYVQLDCPSGLALFRGAEQEFRASAIANALGLVVPAYLLVDLRAVGGSLHAGTVEPRPLFDWLSPPLAAATPAIVGPVVGDELLTTIDHGWGKNALVCIYSRNDQAEVVAHLRDLAGGPDRHRGGPLQGNILGPCSPSILAPILSNGSRHFADKIFARLEAVFQEVHDGQRWGIFARRGFEQTLRNAGLAAVEGYDDLANVPR